MADQTARQRARRTALDAQARMRARRAEQERRRDALGVTVISALAERDAVISVCEARAGAALVKLTEREGLNLTEAVEWCGGAELLTVREAARLRQVAGRQPSHRQSGGLARARIHGAKVLATLGRGTVVRVATVRLGEAGSAALAPGCASPEIARYGAEGGPGRRQRVPVVDRRGERTGTRSVLVGAGTRTRGAQARVRAGERRRGSGSGRSGWAPVRLPVVPAGGSGAHGRLVVTWRTAGSGRRDEA